MAVTFINLMNEFLATNKTLLISYVAILVLAPLQEIGIPHVIGKIIESVKNKTVEMRFVYILIILIILGQVSVSINDYIEAEVFPLFQSFVSRKIISYVFEKNKENLHDILTGKLVGVLVSAPRTMFNFLDTWRTHLLPQLAVTIVAIIYFCFYSYTLGTVLLIAIILYYFMLYITVKNCNGIASQRESFLLTVNEEVTDIFSNIMAIMNLNQVDNEMSYIEKFYKAYESLSKVTLLCTLKYKYTILPLILLLVVVFILKGYSMVTHDIIKLETFVVMLIIFLYVFNSIMKAVNLVKDASIRWGVINENLAVFRSMNVTPNLSTDTYIRTNEYIKFDNVTFSYKNKIIMQNASLSVKQGEKLLLVGQIGRGKTTTLKLLMKYQAPTKGHIYFRGIPIDHIPTDELRSRIGFIPQNPILLNRTLYENIVYGTKGYTKQQVLDLLHELKLSHIFDLDKLDMNVGKMGSKLSGGQRQVVWILRLIIQNPEVLLMDEPTASIDNDTKKLIEELFNVLMKDRTVIIVSHDTIMAKYCDRVVVMK